MKKAKYISFLLSAMLGVSAVLTPAEPVFAGESETYVEEISLPDSVEVLSESEDSIMTDDISDFQMSEVILPMDSDDISDIPEDDEVDIPTLEAGSELASGTLDKNPNVKWVLTSDGTLTISGTGALSYSNNPWLSFKDSVTKVVIEEGVTTTGEFTFGEGFNKLKEVVLPSTLMAIENGAFNQCESLTSITMAEGLKTIGEAAFSQCTSLKAINFPLSVTSIGDEAFAECTGLKSLTLPEGLTTIGKGAFRECTDITGELRFPSTLTAIGSISFQKCINITTLYINKELKKADSGIFGGCTALSEVVIESGMKEIPSYLFDCSDITSLTIPDTVTTIGDYAFRESRLKSIDFPQSVTSIGESAFMQCTDLTSLTLPDKITTIGRSTFEGCSGISGRLVLPSSLSNLGYYAFDSCSGITSVFIGKNITGADKAFRNCTSLSSVEFEFGMKTIPGYICAEMPYLSRVTIPTTVTAIESGAFYAVPDTCVFYATPKSYAYTWAKNAGYTVKTASSIFYKLNGGTNHSENPYSYETGDEKPFKAASMEGFEFCGWYEDSKFTRPITSTTDKIGNLTLYAKWAPYTYSMKFNANYPADTSKDGTAVKMADYVNLSTKKKLTIPRCTFSCDKYEFVSWNTLADGSGTKYLPAEKITAPAKSNGDVLTLYAQWAPVNVSFIMVNPASVTLEAGETTVVKGKPFPINSYTKAVNWTSSDTSIATVTSSDNGAKATITGIKNGETTMIAELADGSGIKASVNVRVAVSDATQYADTPTQATEKNRAKGNIWIQSLNASGYDYTGSPITPQIRVYNNITLMTPGTDYTVTYKNNTNAATPKSAEPPTIIVKLKGNYSGTLTEYFTINPVSLSAAKAAGTLEAADIALMVKSSGNENKVQKITPMIYFQGKKLVNNKDYTLSYDAVDGEKKAYADPGTYAIKINAKSANFTDGTTVNEIICENTGSQTFMPLNNTAVKIALSAKSALVDEPAPKLTVTCNGKLLTEGNEYFANLTGGDKIGTATYVVTGNPAKGFCGQKAVAYAVKAIPVSELTIKTPSITPVAKSGAKPAVTVKYGDTVLTQGVDYKVSYSRNTSIYRQGVVKVTGIGKYTGSKSQNFSIGQQTLRKLTVYADNVAYSKTKNAYKKATIVVQDLDGKKLRNKTDYTIKSYTVSDNSDTPAVGATVTVALEGNGNYNGTTTVTYKICQPIQSIKSARITYLDDSNREIKAFAYTGSEIRPDNIRLTKGAVTLHPKYYEIISYSNNIEKGSGTITVRGVNGYGGMVTYRFNIGSKTIVQ